MFLHGYVLIYFVNLFVHEASGVNIMTLMSTIEPLSGANYPAWREKIEMALALGDIDYALQNPAPKEPEAGVDNYDTLKLAFDIENMKWKQSNRKCLMVIKNSIIHGIRGAIPECDTAREYLEKVEAQFTGSSKMYACTLIKRLVNDHYDGMGNIREHILKLSNLAARLKSMEMEISEGFLVQFIINSLLKDYETFAVNYNSMDEKWDLQKLIAMCAQEEERLRSQRIDYINQVKHSNNHKPNYNNYYKEKGKAVVKFKPSTSPQKAPAKKDQRPVDNDTCLHCRKKGHWMKDCPDFLRWLNKKGNDFITLIDESLYIDFPTDTWWIDSGATVHIANSLKVFV
jgi:hypothetical protein